MPITIKRVAILGRSFASVSTKAPATHRCFSPKNRTHVIFGSNTDVGKTLISTGLLRATLCSGGYGRYIKPLQCGGSDENFITTHTAASAGAEEEVSDDSKLETRTLFRWETPASPHLASRTERQPRSDEEVLNSIWSTLGEEDGSGSDQGNITTLVETAGGVLSPSSASPNNSQPRHASAASFSEDKKNPLGWGWSTQADLYQSLGLPTLLVGDGKLGGISSTLTALESLLLRGYEVHGIVLLEDPVYGNGDALREYASREIKLRSIPGPDLFPNPPVSIVSLPPTPPQPEPLHDWYSSVEVSEKFALLNEALNEQWAEDVERRLQANAEERKG